MPVITVRSVEHFAEAVNTAMGMPERVFHRAEIIIDTNDKIIETSQDSVRKHGLGKQRAWKITDPRWRKLKTVGPEIHFFVKLHGWFFSLSFDPSQDWDGLGVFYSGAMMGGAYGPEVVI